MNEERATYDRVGPSQEEQMARLMAAAKARGVAADLPYLSRMLQQESGYNPNARSPRGAQGLMQLMPKTARSLGVDPNDWRANIDGAVEYWAQLKSKFVTPELTAAAYNAGEGKIKKYGGVPPYPETENYVDIVLGQPKGTTRSQRGRITYPGVFHAFPESPTLPAPRLYDRPGDPGPMSSRPTAWGSRAPSPDSPGLERFLPSALPPNLRPPR